MLPREITKLLEEVFSLLDDRRREDAEKEPEVYLLSLLNIIKERLPEVSSTLKFTIEQASFLSNLERARKQLKTKNKKRHALV